MSIASEIIRLQDDSTAIANAIAAKGVTIPSGSGFDDYATLIGQISGSSSPTIVELAYIAADGGKYIDTGITPDSSTTIIADFKIANISINNTTDRQFVYSDTLNVSTSYSKRWNMFAINFVGAATKSVTSFYDRGVVVSSASGNTLYDRTTSQNVTLTNNSVATGSFGNLYLFSNHNSSHTMKKVSIYEFIVIKNGNLILNLKPVLFNGVPCFYDSASLSYYNFTGTSGNIWYATAAEPSIEIQYTP